ncbi:hypothetical protein D1831_14325 [Lactiplantibacillus garii]|uniref:Capsular polysaccharide biosynthesis protein CpsC n=1 Tax=Lactiplantibacillus garii TaxID=2306423 RepID=A0A3R8J4U8_9LACO|nr:hypothetical protein [Lactiplantibacillus garii]RRK09166.1 hypothetical protein D1831_14325 [Lactiplantibacillus garii]
MKTIFSYLRENRKHWELYLFPMIICLAVSTLFMNNDSFVYTTEVRVVTKGENTRLSTFDTASISVYQTMLKHPSIVVSAQRALKRDYNINISQDDIVKSITTSPVVSGDSLEIRSTNNDSQLAVAIGKQVAKSLYYTLQSYLPQKQVLIVNNATLSNAKSISIWYAVLISVLLGFSIGASIQFYSDYKKNIADKRRISNGQKS